VNLAARRRADSKFGKVSKAARPRDIVAVAGWLSRMEVGPGVGLAAGHISERCQWSL